MKNLLTFAFSIFLLLLIVSCKKDENNPDDPTPPLTPEQHKENLQGTGLTLVGEMSALEGTEGTQSLITMANLVEESGLETESEFEGLAHTIRRINGFTTSRTSATEFLNYRTGEEIEAESLEELWNELKGSFDWNSDTREWEFTEGGEVVQFNFPSDEDGTSNNASLTIRDYQGVEISNPIEDEYEGDLPTSLLLDLIVDDEKEMEFSLAVDYSSDGVPERIETSLFVNPFSLAATFLDSDTQIAGTFTFDNGTQTLMDFSSEINGDFTADNLETVSDPAAIIHSGNVSLTLLEVSFDFEMDFATYYTGMEEIFEDENLEGFDQEQAADALEALMNETIIISAKYVENEVKVADAEWYAFVETYEEGTEWTYTDVTVGARLLFEDGSKIDLEDYLESGFTAVEEELERLEEKLEEDLYNF